MAKNAKEMSFWEHLEELRWRIFKILFTVIIGAVITYYYSDEIIKLLVAPTSELKVDLNLQVLKVTSMFMVKLSISLMGGICLGLPMIIYQVWRFITPAFEEPRTGAIFFIVLFATVFFLLGLTFGYLVLLPFTLHFFTSLTSAYVPVNYNFTLDAYLNYGLWILFACGLAFQLPVIVLFFAKLGLVGPGILRKYRKYALVVFLIVGGILTPPDPLSQIMIVIPLLLLYELSILIAWLVNREKK
ncbi:MAG: twin-arginine translocase subunit TatC [FCB group bacterium]|nr:twin-arginine translocase subunit TatC [FCB group bacterium]